MVDDLNVKQVQSMAGMKSIGRWIIYIHTVVIVNSRFGRLTPIDSGVLVASMISAELAKIDIAIKYGFCNITTAESGSNINGRNVWQG
jgi:hypothetical protein